MANIDDEQLLDELSRLNNELVNLQRQLAKKNAELSRVNELKNQFLGMVSHDLRKPVGAVLSYSQFLIEELPTTIEAEHMAFVDVIHKAAGRMQLLIDDFLDVALIEAGRFPLDVRPVCLAAVAENALTIIRPTAKRRGITIEPIAASGDLQIVGDGPKLEQVVQNLVGNSVEHSESGTTVKIIATAQEHRCRFIISDNGPGIPTERLDTLYTLTGHRRGTKANGERSVGLGLVIVKKIIEAHRGSIDVKTTQGEGTTFTVQIPRQARSEP